MLKRVRYCESYLANEKLNYVKDFMYLAIKFDCKFTFELHANAVGMWHITIIFRPRYVVISILITP